MHSWRLLRWPVAAVAAVGLFLGSYSVLPDFAEAGTGGQLVVGKGTWLPGGTDFVGFYRALVRGGWVKVYCVSPERAEPNRVRLRTVARLPAKSVRVTREIAETLSAHGDARTATQAEAVSQALNAEMGNTTAVARRARYLPNRVQRVAAGYVAEARRRAGPYRLALRLPASPLPGRSAVGSVTLHGAPPGAVRLQHTANVETPPTVHVGRAGTADLTYRTIGGGPVRISAWARVPPTSVRASRTDPGTQLMVTWSPTHTLRARGGYQGSASGIGHSYACSSECAGRPDVTLTVCAPPDDYISRVEFRFGSARHTVSFGAAHVRSCRSWSVVLADGVTVRATWQYRAPHGWTRPLPAAGKFTVDCPPAPPVAVTIGYDCTTATLSVALGTLQDGAIRPLRNGTKHPMVLVVNGAVTDRVSLAPGAGAQVRSYPISCGAHASVTVQAGVERSGGGYNYGQPVEVVTP